MQSIHGTKERSLYVARSERDDESTTYLCVTRLDHPNGSNDPYHTEILLTNDQALELIEQLTDTLKGRS